MQLRSVRHDFLIIEHDGEPIEFELEECRPDSWNDETWIVPDTYPVGPIGETVDTPCIRVAYLVHDDDAQPFEFGEGMWPGVYDDGPFDEDDIVRREIETPGRVYIVHKDSHGPQCNAWSEPFDSTGWSYDAEYDEWTAPDDFRCGDGIHTIPDDVPEDQRQAFSTGVWDEYTKWANGDVWGVVQHYIVPDEPVPADTRTATVIGSAACWGFIGSDYAETAAMEDY